MSLDIEHQTVGHLRGDAHLPDAGLSGPHSTAVAAIRRLHRRRRFAMKLGQKIDLSLQSFVRLNATDWNPSMSSADRERVRKEVVALIAKVRAGKSDERADFFRDAIEASDQAMLPSVTLRKMSEKAMEKLARQLPGYSFVSATRGAGDLGFATIIGETGDLSNYATVSKVWKRLGFAPFDGHAGSTWKRETWRPRKLTAEEWVANPFASERYSLMRMIADSLFKSQWIGKAKTEDGKGKPNGPYGEVYARRAAHTAVTHPDWTPGHVQSDALRVMMKAFLADLCNAWWNDAPRV